MKKVLVTDGVHPSLIEELELAGYHCDYHPKIKLEKVHADLVQDWRLSIWNMPK